MSTPNDEALNCADAMELVHAAGFDTDVTIATGELNNLIPDLIDALGGEMVVGKEGGAE